MTESTYLVDEFAGTLQFLENGTVSYRLFPFGQLVKNGKKRMITRQYAERFKLPHFQPPMKIGSHASDAPGGGKIARLEVREDGLYGVISTTEKGHKVLEDRDYGYHSPEVVWDDGWIEHPSTGEKIYGPMIIGDALLHTPHLGEAASLYSVETFGGEQVSEETISVGLLERVINALRPSVIEAETETPTDATPDTPQNFEAELLEARSRADELSARIETMEQERALAERVATFAAQLGDEDARMHVLLAGLPEEDANFVVERFNALYAQAKAGVDENVGVPGAETDSNSPAANLNIAIQKYMADHAEANYVDAYNAVKLESPGLVEAYEGGL